MANCKILRHGGGYILRHGGGVTLRHDNTCTDAVITTPTGGFFINREPVRQPVYSNINIKSNLLARTDSRFGVKSKLKSPTMTKIGLNSQLIGKPNVELTLYSSLKIRNESAEVKIESNLRSSPTTGLILEGKTNLDQIISLIKLYQILDDDN